MKEKQEIDALVIELEAPQALEALGKTLTTKQLLELIDSLIDQEEQQWKLLPIFVGLPHKSFSGLLQKLTPSQLHLLQKMSNLEPLQHHLMVFDHELEALFAEQETINNKLENEIEAIDVQGLTSSEFSRFENSINQLQQEFKDACKKTENALAFAWSANKGELIDKLSALKERFHRFLTHVIGNKGTEDSESSGLYLLLEDKVSGAFKDSQDDLESLRDDEPALEALAKFSIWYPKQYWELGLLPDVADPHLLDINRWPKDENATEKFRNQAERSLSLLGLTTVKDFKEKKIFSKSMLSDFISANRNKLQRQKV